MKKVLVVEDDLSIRWLLRTLLGTKYNVVVMSNGKDALSWLSEHSIPDLIISDIKMPVMNGFELLENLAMSSLYKNIPVIMLTGFADPETIQRCLDLGVCACFAKPFEPNELLDKIAQPINSKRVLINKISGYRIND